MILRIIRFFTLSITGWNIHYLMNMFNLNFREGTSNLAPSQSRPRRHPSGQNSWIYSPKIEDFYQEFMGSFLACSVETTFYRNDFRRIHNVLEKGIP